MTRRELLGQGFLAGSATVLGGGITSLFTPDAHATLAADLEALKGACGIGNGNLKIPFICIDLAGGANIAGSNVLVGQNGQLDVLSTAGYSKLGLPGDQIPGVAEANGPTLTSNGDHTDTSLGLAFHSDSAFLRGMQASFRTTGLADSVNGAIIPARSENDTGNNPHNPLYGIQKAGAGGSILTLCGSENSESGGNSIAPIMMVNPEYRPTKIDRPEDVVGLAPPSGALAGILGPNDVVPVLESMYRLSDQKMATAGVETGLNFPDPNYAPLTRDEVVEDLVKCGYLSSASTTDQFGNVQLDPGLDTNIVDDVAGIFTNNEFFDGGRDGREFRKTASVMKMVIDGYAGAGCIEMGGYDYHGGMRQEGEIKDFRAGRCMGACLEYAARMNKPLMMYVFSDGSLSSNGTIDDSLDGRGKGEWSSDNQSTAAGFFLVYNPPGNGGRATLIGPPEVHQQIGAFSSDGSVVRSGSPGANNVNLLVEMVVLNYMALHGDVANGNFQAAFPNHGLGANLDIYTAFNQIVAGQIP